MVDQQYDIGGFCRGRSTSAPIATPTSAAASAGASLTPSPTIITVPFLRSERTTRTF